MTLVLNPALASRIPAAARARIDSLQAQDARRHDSRFPPRPTQRPATSLTCRHSTYSRSFWTRRSTYIAIPDYPNAVNGVQLANVGDIERVACRRGFLD